MGRRIGSGKRVATEGYRNRWIAVNGDLPHPCCFCGGPVAAFGRRRGDGVIHHVDGDRKNNDPANLVLAHVECHHRHHDNLPHGRAQTAETRAKISAATKGVPKSAATRARMSEAQRKRHAAEEGS